MNETQQQQPKKEKREFTTVALKDELTKKLSSRLETVTTQNLMQILNK